MLLGEEKKVTSYFSQLYPCLSIKQLDHMYVVSLRDTLGAGSFSRCPIDKDRLYRILTGSQEKFLKGRRRRRVQKKCKMAIESIN